MKIGDIKLVDSVGMVATKDTPELSFVDTQTKHLIISPPVQLEPGEEYKIEVYSDNSIRVWKSVARTAKVTNGSMQ